MSTIADSADYPGPGYRIKLSLGHTTTKTDKENDQIIYRSHYNDNQIVNLALEKSLSFSVFVIVVWPTL